MTLDPAHPVVRAAAEGMAKDVAGIVLGFVPEHEHARTRAWAAECLARDLCDFSRAATRDYWVRWLSTPKNHPDRLMWGLAAKYRDSPEALSRAVVAALSSSSPE